MKELNLKDYDLFIVDFDGTIVDTMKMWKNVCVDFIVSLGVEPSKEILYKIHSKTNIEIAKIIRDEYRKDLSYEMVSQLFFDFIKSRYILQELKPNAIKFLNHLNTIGDVVLYSATAGVLLDVLLDKHNLRSYYKNIYSGSDLGISKDDGTGYLKVIEYEGGCKNPLIIEDAIHAITGAKMHNLDVLGIIDYSNQNHLDELKELSDYIIDLNNF